MCYRSFINLMSHFSHFNIWYLVLRNMCTCSLLTMSGYLFPLNMWFTSTFRKSFNYYVALMEIVLKLIYAYM